MIACEVGAGGEARLAALSAQLEVLPGESWQCMGSCWLLRTDLGVSQVRNALRYHLAEGDRLLVGLLNDFACWHGFDGHQTDWLLARL